jgi:hypothetical protein
MGLSPLQVCVSNPEPQLPTPARLLQSRVSDSARPEPRRFPPPWSVEETDACFELSIGWYRGAAASS